MTLSSQTSASAAWAVPPPSSHRLNSLVNDGVVPVVYIVDDDASVLESLDALIRSAGWRAETFMSAPDFLSCPHPAVPCCLVLDVRLPLLSGLDLQEHLAGRPDVPIIFITAHADVQTSVQAMKAGAVDFLMKPFKGDVLLHAVAGAIDRSCAALRLDAETYAARNAYATLSRREREVMALVVCGLLNKQIAGQLGVCEDTVKAHRGQVMRKMRAHSLADLVIIAWMIRQSSQGSLR